MAVQDKYQHLVRRHQCGQQILVKNQENGGGMKKPAHFFTFSKAAFEPAPALFEGSAFEKLFSSTFDKWSSKIGINFDKTLDTIDHTLDRP